MNKFLKNTLLIVSCIYLAGCMDASKFDRQTKINTTWGAKFVTTTCLDGVVYYSSSRALAVAYNRNGTIKTC